MQVLKGLQKNLGEKAQPLIDMLNARLSLLSMPNKHMCINEMMIPSKSKYGPRVYQIGKPHPWGFKLFSIADMIGICFRVHLYSGKFPQVHPYSNLGSTNNRVLWLVEHVPRIQGYFVYMDNYFTSIPLMEELLELGIKSMGTIRIPNALGFADACIPDKELKEKGERAFAEYLVSFNDIMHPGIRIIRRNDSNVFNFAHTTGSAEPTTKVQRWYRGKDNRCHRVEIDMPSVVGKYNKCMGGVDKMDSIFGMYPCKLKVKRWPMNIFWHNIDLTMGNAWLLYQQENKRRNRRNKCMSQFQFKGNVAETWMTQNADPNSRRRRSNPGRRRARVSRVATSTRYDGKHHMPDATSGKSERKRCAFCNASTNVYCTICEEHLCMFHNRNCFRPFHNGPFAADEDSDQNSDVIDDVDSRPLDAAESQSNESTE